MKQKSAPFIVIAAVIVFAAIMVWYLVVFQKNGSVSSLFGSLFSNSPAQCKYGDGDVCAFIASWKDLNNIAVTTTITATSGKTMSTRYEIEGSNKVHLVSWAGVQEQANWIYIDNIAFIKDYSDDTWWKQDLSDEIKQEMDTGKNFTTEYSNKEQNTEDKTRYEKIGTEACGAKMCFKYKVVDPTATDTSRNIYFDTKDHRLQKLVSEKDGARYETVCEYGTVSISAPTTIKELNLN